MDEATRKAKEAELRAVKREVGRNAINSATVALAWADEIEETTPCDKRWVVGDTKLLAFPRAVTMPNGDVDMVVSDLTGARLYRTKRQAQKEADDWLDKVIQPMRLDEAIEKHRKMALQMMVDGRKAMDLKLN